MWHLSTSCHNLPETPQAFNSFSHSLEGKLPSGSKLHLFGVKGSVLSELKMLDWVGSADSMAYDFGARVKARKGGHSNSMAHRSKEMTDWMSAAARRIQPAAGDQFRLLFA